MSKDMEYTPANDISLSENVIFFSGDKKISPLAAIYDFAVP